MESKMVSTESTMSDNAFKDNVMHICIEPTKSVTVYKEDEEQLLINELEEEYSDYRDYEERNKELFEAPLFDGTARITIKMILPAKSFDIWAEVTAVCEDGALLSSFGIRDFLWLGFVKEKAVLRWDSGSGPTELQSGRVKTDGRTRISARRYKKDAILRLGSVQVLGTAQGRMSSLDVEPYVHIGHPPESNITRSSGASSGFVGCVHRLRVSGQDIIPSSGRVPVEGQRVRPCTPDNLAKLVCP